MSYDCSYSWYDSLIAYICAMQNLIEQIFNISSEASFNQCALEIFKFQYASNSIYRDFANGIDKSNPKHFTEIPFLPISFFKTHRVVSSEFKEQAIFKSSGTGGDRSSHYVKDISIYEQSFHKAYHTLISNPKDQVIIALLPNYVEQGESSLVYMVDQLIKATNNPLSGFLLNEPNLISQRYKAALEQNKQVVIFGVSYALLDLAEQKIDLSKALIIETGGMKGRRKELTKQELHHEIIKGTKVNFVSSEYGMTELLSQGYSNDNQIFNTPSWMKILIRDINDPLSLIREGKTGGINVIDLANIYSCSFIATQDLGKSLGSQFEIMGRFDNSDIRGCNLLVQ